MRHRGQMNIKTYHQIYKASLTFLDTYLSIKHGIGRNKLQDLDAHIDALGLALQLTEGRTKYEYESLTKLSSAFTFEPALRDAQKLYGLYTQASKFSNKDDVETNHIYQAYRILKFAEVIMEGGYKK